jgi:NIPSNAP
MAFYELRQYHVRKGKMNEWLKLMEGEIIPYQVAKGMLITGSWRGEDDDSKYFWMRRFKNEAERKRLYKAVYETDYWQNEVSPRVGKLLDRKKMVVTRVVPTAKSVVQ